MNGITVYRELHESAPESLFTWLEQRQQLFPIEDDKGDVHLFVENDQPRDADITPLIVENTAGFALFADEPLDENGNQYIGSYRSLDRALTAQSGARLVVQPEVDLEDDPDVDIAAPSAEDAEARSVPA